MPRVLHLIDTGGPGGAETVLASLVEVLPELGWASKVLVPRVGWLSSRLEAAGVPMEVVGGTGSADVGYLKALVKEVRAFRPALIQAHFLGSGVYGSMASALSTNCPLVCTFHGIPDVKSSDHLLPLKARILSRDRNRIIYVSRHLRAHLEPLLGVPPRLGRVVHNGVAFHEGMDPLEAKKALRAGSEEKVIGAVGNIRKAKDYGNLLRAARLVCDEREDVRFTILGEWENKIGGTLRRLQEELLLQDRVHFLGFRPDAGALMSGFDLFVSSSAEEGLPLASLEAMGRGKPVVLTRCGGVPEMVENGQTGVLVPPKNPRALANALLGLLAAPEVADEIGRRARSATREQFGLPVMVGNYVEVYRKLSKAFPVNHA